MSTINKNKSSNTEKKLRDIHTQIMKSSTRITKIVNDALLNILNDLNNKNDVFCKELENDKYKNEEINNILLECIYDLNNNSKYICKYNSDEYEELVFSINKKCETHYYNNSINDKLNNDIDFLLKKIQYDKNVLKSITKKTATEKFILTLLRCARRQDLLKIFTTIPEYSKTFAVCRLILEKDCNMIKYIENQTEELCSFAIIMGHKNLSDIHPSNLTENICKKYIDVDINNLKAIKYNHNIKFSKMFFIEYIKSDPTNIKLINQIYVDPEILTYVVNHDGLLIKYINNKFQTLRLIELACKQNPNSKYYVTYDCPKTCNIDYLESNLTHYINLLKQQISINKEHFVKFEELLKKMLNEKINISCQSGILLNIVNDNSKLLLMTPENYVCHQHQLKLEKQLITNFKILLNKTSFSLTQNNKKYTRYEYSIFLTDNNSNEFIFFMEIINAN